MRDLMRHDGSVVMSREVGNCGGLTVEQVNEFVNEGIQYAMSHSWEDVTI